MTARGVPHEDAVDTLRREFDATFARAPADVRPDADAFLAVIVGGDGYCIRVREISALTAARKIVALASPIPEFLGLAGIKGRIVPVYSLAALMGYPREARAPSWFVLGKGAQAVAFAFAGLEGQVESAPSDVLAPGDGERRRHVGAILQTSRGVHGVLDMASLESDVAERAAAAATT